jgi:[ribosomal protein S18]-alanine N-acetyltransferase
VERRRTSTAARLTSIVVSPEAAGAGVGGRLLTALEEAALSAGARRMRLEVRAGNDAARRLYETAGYQRVETLDSYYEDGGAALRYEKTLAST